MGLVPIVPDTMAATNYAETVDRLSSRIVEAVATAGDEDPLALEPRLYDVVDVEALDRLVRADAPVAVEFEYGDHVVEVRGDGSVAVDGDAVAEVGR